MSADAAPAKNKLTEPSTQLSSPYGSAGATGYRVSIVPGALEVSARLVTPEEVRNLIKVLQAGGVALESTTDGDMDKPLTLAKPVQSTKPVNSTKALDFAKPLSRFGAALSK